MNKFNFIKTKIPDLFEIEPTVFGDERGFFLETYNEQEFLNMGIKVNFVQDNQSRSKKGVLRGIHFQKNNPQGKLVRVISGSVLDIAVDLRKSSETYGKYHAVILSEENKKIFWIPEGFGHGFLVLSEFADFTYKCTRLYNPSDEGGIIWNDPDIGINWGEEELIISEKDKKNPCLKDLNFYF